MLGVKHKISLLFAVFLLLGVNSSFSQSEARVITIDSNNLRSRKKTGLERRLKILEKFEDLYKEQAPVLRNDIEGLEEDIEGFNGDSSDLKKLKKRLRSKQSRLKSLENFLEQPLTPGLGDAVLEGIIGKKSNLSEDLILGSGFDAVLEGAGLGVAYKTAEVFGDNIGKSVNTVVGHGFEYGLGWLKNFFGFFNRHIFHGGHRPFDKNEIQAWKDLLNNGFVRLERALRDSAKYESRSTSMIARKIEGEDSFDDFDSEGNEVKVVSVWKMVADEYAQDCDFLIYAIYNRKSYYKGKTDGFIVHTSKQLQNALIGLKSLLMRAETLKDFAGLLEVKSGFPLLTKRLTDLFDVLAKNLDMNSFSFGRKNSRVSSSSNVQRQNKYQYGGNNDDDYPRSFMD